MHTATIKQIHNKTKPYLFAQLLIQALQQRLSLPSKLINGLPLIVEDLINASRAQESTAICSADWTPSRNFHHLSLAILVLSQQAELVAPHSLQVGSQIFPLSEVKQTACIKKLAHTHWCRIVCSTSTYCIDLALQRVVQLQASAGRGML